MFGCRVVSSRQSAPGGKFSRRDDDDAAVRDYVNGEALASASDCIIPRGSTSFPIVASLSLSLSLSAVFISAFAAAPPDALEHSSVCARVRWPAPLRNGIKRRVSRILPLDARFLGAPRARWCVQRPRKLRGRKRPACHLGRRWLAPPPLPNRSVRAALCRRYVAGKARTHVVRRCGLPPTVRVETCADTLLSQRGSSCP